MEITKLLNPIIIDFNNRKITLEDGLGFFDQIKDQLFAKLVIELRIRQIWGYYNISFYDFENEFNSKPNEEEKLKFIRDNLEIYFRENHDRKDLSKLEKIKFSLFLNRYIDYWRPNSNSANKNEIIYYNRKVDQLNNIKILHNLLGCYLSFFPILWSKLYFNKPAFNKLIEYMRVQIESYVSFVEEIPQYPIDIENFIKSHENAFKIFDKNVNFKYIAAMVIKIRVLNFWGFKKIQFEDIKSIYNNHDDNQKKDFIQNSIKEYFSRGSKETTVNFDKLGKLKFFLFLHDQNQNLMTEETKRYFAIAKNVNETKRYFAIAKNVNTLNEHLGEYLRIFPVPFHHMDENSVIRRTQFLHLIKAIKEEII
ncbi:hypothetical protein Glove_187g82 [Diversispora epigaea]|uniref:Uncharacterized protein n=1 Tax=Diversispora epigaea TaxID=1348612 RepID=A0A397IQ75_9GLOM|nr:hypothetical protein Glove_187g82 [Diversispora epigaea]